MYRDSWVELKRSLRISIDIILKLVALIKKHLRKTICAIFFISTILLVYIYINQGVLVSIKSLLYFLPLLVFLLLFLIFKNNFLDSFYTPLKNLIIIPNIVSKRLHQIIMFNLFLITLGFLSLAYYPTRNLLYLIIVSLNGTILFVQVLLTKNLKPSYFFLQAILISLGLTWGVTLKYPLYYGYTDILPHLSFISTIAEQGVINITGIYENFPLYHTFLATAKILMGSSIQASYFIILGFISVCFLLLPYIIFFQITKNIKLSLTISLLFLFSSVVIFESRYLVTRNFAVILTLFILYLLLKQINNSKKIIFKTLILIFSLNLILMHHITSLFFLIILIGLLIIKNVTNTRFSFQNYFLIFGTGVVYYWLYVARKFAYDLAISFKESLIFLLSFETSIVTEEITRTSLTITESFKSLIGINNQMILIFFSLFGLLFLLYQWKEMNKYIKTFSIFGILTFPFLIANPFIDVFSMSFLLYRIPMITHIFWVIIFLFGFLIFLKTIISMKKKGKIKLISICGITFFIICFTAVANSHTASDVKDISNIIHGEPKYFTTEDLSSFRFCDVYIPANSSAIVTDLSSNVYLKYLTELNPSVLNITNLNISSHYPTFNGKKYNFLLLRMEFGKEGRNELTFYKDEMEIRYKISQTEVNNLAIHFSKIYDNSVSIYFRQ